MSHAVFAPNRQIVSGPHPTEDAARAAIAAAQASGDLMADRMEVGYVVVVTEPQRIVAGLPTTFDEQIEARRLNLPVSDTRAIDEDEANQLIDAARYLGLPNADDMWVEPIT